MILFLLLLIPMCVLPSSGQEALPSHMVNPLIGTDGHGHTYPGAALPFGMVQLSPDTRVEGWDACAGYHYSDTTILGFSHLHLSGTGIPDYGDILLTPFSGSRTLQEAQAPAPFSHEEESASPGYYRVMLKDRRIVAELTATDRVGIHRYTSAGTDSLGIAVDLVHGLGPDRVIEAGLDVVSATEISGHRYTGDMEADLDTAARVICDHAIRIRIGVQKSALRHIIKRTWKARFIGVHKSNHGPENDRIRADRSRDDSTICIQVHGLS